MKEYMVTCTNEWKKDNKYPKELGYIPNDGEKFITTEERVGKLYLKNLITKDFTENFDVKELKRKEIQDNIKLSSVQKEKLYDLCDILSYNDIKIKIYQMTEGKTWAEKKEVAINNSKKDNEEKKSKASILAAFMIVFIMPLGGIGAAISFFGIIWALVEICDSRIKQKGLSVVALIIFIITMLLGIATANNRYILTNNGIKMVSSNDYVLIKEETNSEREKDGTYKIEGKIKQNVDGSYTGIMPILKLLDSKGNKVRSTTGISISNYEGNNIWSFTVTGNDADNVIVDYELESCYGY